MLGNILLDLQRDIPLSLSGLQSCPNPLVLKPHHCVTGISYRLCSKQLFWNTYLLIHWFCLLLALLNIVTLAFFISFIEVVFKMAYSVSQGTFQSEMCSWFFFFFPFWRSLCSILDNSVHFCLCNSLCMCLSLLFL